MTDTMTNAELNRAIREKIEKRCVHKWVIKPIDGCDSQNPIDYECMNCGAEFSGLNPTSCPDYLSDDAYILGLIIKYEIDIKWCYNQNSHLCEGAVNRAIALVALKKERNGG